VRLLPLLLLFRDFESFQKRNRGSHFSFFIIVVVVVVIIDKFTVRVAQEQFRKTRG